MFSKWAQSGTTYYGPNFNQNIQSILKHAAQYNSTAKQDSNPLIALIHNNSALSYAYSVRKMVPSKDLYTVTTMDIDEFIESLEESQLEYIKKITTNCPNLQPTDEFNVYTGYLG